MRSMRRYVVWTLLLLLLASLACAADDDAAHALCSTDEEKQFIVRVATADPLGLRLSERLEVLEFVADEQGRSRAVEASGLAEIGDRLIQVNDESLLDRSLADAVAALTAASLPKVLRFQTHDGRCHPPEIVSATALPSGARALEAVSSSIESEGTAVTSQHDYLVRSHPIDQQRLHHARRHAIAHESGVALRSE